jgi:hypothetical protein
MMNASGARENACTRGVVYTLVDFTLTFLCSVGDKGLRYQKDSHAQPVQLAVASGKK